MEAEREIAGQQAAPSGIAKGHKRTLVLDKPGTYQISWKTTSSGCGGSDSGSFTSDLIKIGEGRYEMDLDLGSPKVFTLNESTGNLVHESIFSQREDGVTVSSYIAFAITPQGIFRGQEEATRRPCNEFFEFSGRRI